MRDRCGRGRFRVCGRMFLSVFGSGFLQASQKIAERNRVLARARSRRSLRAYDPLWVQFVVHVCVGAKNRKKNRKALGEKCGRCGIGVCRVCSLVVLGNTCAATRWSARCLQNCTRWFAFDGIKNSSRHHPRVFGTASGDKRRSTELCGATPNARQNCTKPRPKVFGTARGDL